MIYYFSSTGNDKYVAERIAKETNDVIYFIPDCLDQKKLEYHLKPEENVGFVIPTYFGGFPKIVIAFLSQLKMEWEKKNYMYFVGTYGADPGNICWEAKQRLKRLGKDADATYTIQMVDNWIPYFDMTDKEYVHQAETKAESDISIVVQNIKQHRNIYAPDKIVSDKDQEGRTQWYENACKTEFFSVNDHCIGCGLCERQCPMHVIQLINKKPHWQEDECTLCLGCVHRCPVNAIAYTKDTIGHGQYFNSHVKPNRF